MSKSSRFAVAAIATTGVVLAVLVGAAGQFLIIRLNPEWIAGSFAAYGISGYVSFLVTTRIIRKRTGKPGLEVSPEDLFFPNF